MHLFKHLIFTLLLSCPLAALDYDVKFSGIDNKEMLQIVELSSDLVSLKQRPPSSLNGLRFRAENDLPNIYKVLKSFGYYDAVINTDIEEDGKVLILVDIQLGPQYVLESYVVQKRPPNTPCKELSIKKLEIELHKPISWKQIINKELLILTRLSTCGYPLASIGKREINVDTRKKRIDILENVNLGPLSHFGPITILGLKEVKPQFVEKKIFWKEGDVYSSTFLETTQKKLIETNLFSSALVTHAESLDEEGNLPMKIHLTESKHKTFGFGVSYATIDGFGGTVGWTHRNLGGMGEILRIEADVSQLTFLGLISYTKPDFLLPNQNYVALLEALRENIVVYLASTYRHYQRIDRTFNEHVYGSFGIKAEYIDVKDSINNGNFTLIAPVIFTRYSSTDSLLDPTSGVLIEYENIPYFSIGNEKAFFVKQTLTTNFYIPTSRTKKLVLAFRTQLGSIADTELEKIPFPKRFLGGSDDDLRGFRYKTVSPTNDIDDPKGGKSVIYITFEPRFRVTETIGIVPFTDWGIVSEKPYPTPYGKWYKSAGLGLRYFTFFGPIRADLAFAINKRPRDPNFRLYVSIGQTF